MLKALILLIQGLTQENITRGVQKSINEMAYLISVSEQYTEIDREFARQIFESSGRPYMGFVPKMKLILWGYQIENRIPSET